MRALTVLSLLVLASCGRRGTLYDAALAPLPLVATSRVVVQVVPQTRRAVVLNPEDASATPLVTTPGARAVERVPGAEVLAVIAGTARAPVLDLVDLEARTVRSLELPGAFDQLTFSADGRFGVLTYDAERSVGLAARNLNEVGLLNVTSQTVTRVQLDTEGLAPRFVQFAPVVGGRRLVAIALERGITVFDALHPEVAPRRIGLRPAGSSADAPVVELLFSRDTRWLFARALGLDDVIVLELGSEVGAPLSASINFVAGGTGLSALALAPPAAGDAVLAAFATSGEAVLLDARGIQDRVKRLRLPASLPNLVALTEARVVLWSAASSTVVVWDVLDGRSGTVMLTGVPERAVVNGALERVAFTLGGVASLPSAVNVVSITEEPNRLRVRAQAIQLARRPSAVRASADGALLFLGVPASASTRPVVVTLSLATLAVSELALDAEVGALFHVPGPGRLVAVHASPTGDVSVLPVGATERLEVRRLSDFALAGDLDRPEDAR